MDDARPEDVTPPSRKEDRYVLAIREPSGSIRVVHKLFDQREAAPKWFRRYITSDFGHSIAYIWHVRVNERPFDSEQVDGAELSREAANRKDLV